MSRFFRQTFLLIVSIINGCYNTVRDYVLPIIRFINVVKELVVALPVAYLESKKAKKGDEEKPVWDWIKYFVEKLQLAEAFIKQLFNAFVAAGKTLLPDVITGKTFEECLLQFVEHFKTLNNTQRAWLSFKMASLMLLYFKKDEMKENEADFITQATFSWTKYHS